MQNQPLIDFDVTVAVRASFMLLNGKPGVTPLLERLATGTDTTIVARVTLPSHFDL